MASIFHSNIGQKNERKTCKLIKFYVEIRRLTSALQYFSLEWVSNFEFLHRTLGRFNRDILLYVVL